jgi:glycogen debranching enzyme
MTAIPRQPLLDDATIVLRAPSQAWSRASGEMGDAAIDGVYHGDVRHVRRLRMRCASSALEWISVAADGPSRTVFGGLLREVDSAMPDPRMRLLREREIRAGSLHETWRIVSGRDIDVPLDLALELEADFTSLHEVKAGTAAASSARMRIEAGVARAAHGDAQLTLDAPGARISADGPTAHARWRVTVPAHGEARVTWTLRMSDAALVVAGTEQDAPWDRAAVAARGAAIEPRLGRWLDRALGDLDALRLVLPDHPDDAFYAAGAPWFFTLFGRDSLWAARLALPLDVSLAASTLRVLARLQGSDDDPETAQQPGKILHELRATALEIPAEGVLLPPLYFGSVDSTALWVCLLVDAWRAGMPEAEVRALLPALDGALTWLLERGDADGDGFLDYVDLTGRGLANQGWKDSGDSIQWRDGALAEGPIALCEVQAYAYEAVRGAADMLEALDAEGEHRSEPLRAWAAELRDRFAAAYWVHTPEGRYPAIALDRHKRPVDTLTSNIGHLLGTGILDPDDETHVAALLRADSLSSGYGIRTMSTDAAGYWPLAYHGGSVWAHDTAIAVHGMMRAGLHDDALAVSEGLLAAAEGFGYRMPELHAGDPADQTSTPTPYPAACRPQAWSAAAAVTVLAAAEAATAAP